MNDIQITKHNENHITYTVTNPSKRLLAMCRYLRIQKAKRKKELIEYAKTNSVFNKPVNII